MNLSIGCDWFLDEFAAGQSPLCREVDQLVGTGVVAVVRPATAARPESALPSAATGAIAAGVGPLQSNDAGAARFVEDSGTSMAAPHVSGAIAAFLSVRDEYIGQPDDVKQLFMSNATSLGRPGSSRAPGSST